MNTSGAIFLPDGENPRRSDFDHSKTAFCEYWKSIKINNSMTCVSKEYVIKTKVGTGAMFTAKNDIFIFLLRWIDFWWAMNKSLVEKTEEKWASFGLVRETHIHHWPKWPSYYCKVWALCVSKIYMVYVFSCLLSARNKINLSGHEHV